MNKFNKSFEYKDYKFNTTIELCTRQEKRIGGNTYNTITTTLDSINIINANPYNDKDEILNHQIEEYVEKHYNRAIKYIDSLTDTTCHTAEEELLICKLGFNRL